MSNPIEGCPRPETPIRDRAWTAEQEAGRDPVERMEDARCPPTYRREEAVKALIALGWAWDGKDWIAPTPAEQCGRADLERWGLPDSKQPAQRMDDGYWTPWHIAQEALQAALAQNAQGEAVGEIVPRFEGHSVVQLFDADLPLGTKLYTHAERARVPDGWGLKPSKATGDMVLAGIHENLSDPGPNVFNRIWAAMFAAAPSQPEDAA